MESKITKMKKTDKVKIKIKMRINRLNFQF